AEEPFGHLLAEFRPADVAALEELAHHLGDELILFGKFGFGRCGRRGHEQAEDGEQDGEMSDVKNPMSHGPEASLSCGENRLGGPPRKRGSVSRRRGGSYGNVTAPGNLPHPRLGGPGQRVTRSLETRRAGSVGDRSASPPVADAPGSPKSLSGRRHSVV